MPATSSTPNEIGPQRAAPKSPAAISAEVAQRLKDYEAMIYDESYKPGESEAIRAALENLPVSKEKGFDLPSK